MNHSIIVSHLSLYCYITCIYKHAHLTTQFLHACTHTHSHVHTHAHTHTHMHMQLCILCSNECVHTCAHTHNTQQNLYFRCLFSVSYHYCFVSIFTKSTLTCIIVFHTTLCLFSFNNQYVIFVISSSVTMHLFSITSRVAPYHGGWRLHSSCYEQSMVQFARQTCG